MNMPTLAEAERLVLLIEECAEVQHAACKILRHGFESYHPEIKHDNNRGNLATELGQLKYAINLVIVSKDVLDIQVSSAEKVKANSVQDYLHHQNIHLLRNLARV